MDSDDDSDPFDDAEAFVDEDDIFLQRVHQNDPDIMELRGSGSNERVQNMTNVGWEQLGQDIAQSSYLELLRLYGGALNDHKMTFLFRGLTSSNSIKEIILDENGFSAAGVRSMGPFLQNANNLTKLFLNGNNIQSGGFNLLFRALRDSPIEMLNCNRCGIESIEIDRNNFPKHLMSLDLDDNNINADGCRGLATLLHGGDCKLADLWLNSNKIDDEGVEILVDALQNNTSLGTLDLRGNDGITNQGHIMLLKLVSDTSSIKATLQSNHTLRYLDVKDLNEDGLGDADVEIQNHIDTAIMINRSYQSKELAGREKVIRYQLQSTTRAELCRLQGVDRSIYSEIDPLHLPEVLSLIDRRHGQGELYAAVSLSIMTLFSTMNREKCIQQQREYCEAKIAEHRSKIVEQIAKIEELDAELATMKEAAGRNQHVMESQSNKRRRT